METRRRQTSGTTSQVLPATQTVDEDEDLLLARTLLASELFDSIPKGSTFPTLILLPTEEKNRNVSSLSSLWSKAKTLTTSFKDPWKGEQKKIVLNVLGWVELEHLQPSTDPLGEYVSDEQEEASLCPISSQRRKIVVWRSLCMKRN
jgi:hypothetical protein